MRWLAFAAVALTLAAGPATGASQHPTTALRQPCGFAFAPTNRFLGRDWQATVVHAGPVRFLRARGRARGHWAGPQVRKLPTLMRPGRRITITVEDRSPHALAFVRPGPHQRPLGAPRATIVLDACPAVPPEVRLPGVGPDNAVPLFVVVRRDACVHLAIRRDGEPVRRRALGLGRRCVSARG